MKFAIPACLIFACLPARAADPVVTDVRGQQRADGSELVDVYYTVTDPDSPTVTVGLQVSADEGATWTVPVATVSQAVGTGVTPGKDKHILWNTGADWNNQFSNKVRFKVTASDSPLITGEFALIPAGTFQMGDALDGLSNAPGHSIYVSGFYMGKYEVTKELWDEVQAWGLNNGYTDLLLGNGSYASKGANHPVHSITWYDMVKWCNARSQKEGLTPCYTVTGSTYKTGSSAPDCNWNANGYRLPTEAEWEKAARGGLSGKRFPWGDTITHSLANYYSSTSYAYDVSLTRGYHPTYYTGSYPYSSPVGTFAPNGYGLYDMAGNMWEWCWDWYGSSYYTSSPGTDPRGAVSGSYRVIRGGGWGNDAYYCRVALRDYYLPGDTRYGIGFRLARSSVP